MNKKKPAGGVAVLPTKEKKEKEPKEKEIKPTKDEALNGKFKGKWENVQIGWIYLQFKSQWSVFCIENSKLLVCCGFL